MNYSTKFIISFGMLVRQNKLHEDTTMGSELCNTGIYLANVKPLLKFHKY